MGKTRSRKKKQTLKSKEAGKATAGQIARIGEKERCTNCKNWVQFGSFELQLGKPPHRAECGDNAKCDGCDLNLCYDCCITEKNSNRLTKWLLCANNRTGFGGSNDCIRGTPIKICSDCANVKRKRSDAGISDMEHQKDYTYIHCGGEMCIPDEGSGGRPRQECRECALSGERMMRICHLCDKIRCIACIGYAKDLGGDLSGETNTGWGIIKDMMDMGDMLKTTFINDFIKRCGDCGRDVCMECTSEETLASNMSKMRLFDCEESGCRCIRCMTKERMSSKVEDDTLFKCDECRTAKIKCHNPGCNNRFKFTCTRCGKANYCSKECQVAAWSLHKPECQKKKKSSKASASGEKKQKGSTRTDKVSAKMKRDEAKEMVGDLKNAHATYGHDKEEDE